MEQVQNIALDLNLLDRKLLEVNASPSVAGTSCSSTPEPEEILPHVRARAYAHHDRLVDLGGRPTQPVNSVPRTWDPEICPKHMQLYFHWDLECSRASKELERWIQFQKYQQKRRSTAESFNEYKRMLSRHRRLYQLPHFPKVRKRLDRQGKLDEWAEYFIYEQKKIKSYKNGSAYRDGVNAALLSWIQDEMKLVQNTRPAPRRSPRLNRVGC